MSTTISVTTSVQEISNYKQTLNIMPPIIEICLEVVRVQGLHIYRDDGKSIS